MAKKSVKKKVGSSPAVDKRDMETEALIERTERRLTDVLSPLEERIMALQSVLVWEKPALSAALFVSVHVLFWLATRLNFYHLLGLTGMVVVFCDVWFNSIWPEIRVPPPPNEDTEGWTPVHPSMLSVPEIAHILSSNWVLFNQWLEWYFSLRKDSPPQFFLLSTFSLSMVAVAGTFISGLTLVYVSVLGMLLWPAIVYHKLVDFAWDKVEPVVKQAENTLRVHRTRSKRSIKKKGREMPTISADLTDSDSDTCLQEFVPPPGDPKLSVVLTAAVVDNSDNDSSVPTPGRLTPANISQGPSREHSDTESHDETFVQGLELPSFDDAHLDDSYQDELPDESLPDLTLASLDTTEAIAQTPQASSQDDDSEPEVARSESMQFVPTHFKESDSDREENLSHGLEFPDIEDEPDKAQAENTDVSSLTQKAMAVLGQQAMAQTAANLMSSTLSSLSKLSETVRAASGPGQGDSSTSQVHYHKDLSSSADGTVLVTPTPNVDKDMPLTESDILEDFEFLNEEDLDNFDDQEDA